MFRFERKGIRLLMRTDNHLYLLTLEIKVVEVKQNMFVDISLLRIGGDTSENPGGVRGTPALT